MRRISARWLIVIPWLLTAALVLVAARTSLAAGIIAFLLSVTCAALIANGLSRALRTLRTELRTGRADNGAHDGLAEIHGIRAAVNAAHNDSRTRLASSSQAEQQLLAVLASITEGILQVSASGRLVHVNPAAREMLNLPLHVEGQSAAALIRVPELRVCIEKAAAGVSFEPLEVFFDERYLLVSPRPLRSEHVPAETAGAVLAIVDLTEIRRLESVRRDFVANVSHELKTPLTSIRGYAETLLSEDVPRNVQLQFLDVIHENAARIQRIVDDLLDLSRLQSGGWQPELQKVDPAALAQDIWAGCEVGHRKNIEFIVSAATPADVIADPGGLRQIFSNLFDNAIRYTPNGGKVSVDIHPTSINGSGAAASGEYIEVVVTDTGSGIPREALPRIFERFYRVDPARSRQEGGTGLGLSIVKHLVERMAGEVTAESELGKGTAIRIRLPAAEA